MCLTVRAISPASVPTCRPAACASSFADGVSADTVVQKLCIEAREEGRACSVVSSDGTIQAVVMGKGVTRISSRMLVDEIKQIDNDVHEAEEAPQIKMTLGSRLSPEALAKLKALRGR